MVSTANPSDSAGDGRNSNGRFAPGNGFGRGNPHARKVQKLRSALLNAVSEKDLQEIAASLIRAAKEGDVAAAREILDRTLGKPAQVDVLERVEELEQAIEEYAKQQMRGAWRA